MAASVAKTRTLKTISPPRVYGYDWEGASPLLTSANVESYHRDDFFLAGGMFRPQEVAELKSHIVKLVSAEDPQRTAKGIRVWFAGELDSSLRNWVIDQRMATALQSLVGPDVEFLSAKTIFKNPRVSFASPWHQDWFYWKSIHKITAWIALDQANKSNECLKVIPASHHSIAQMVDVDDKKIFLKQMKSEDMKGRPVVCLELEPGDVLFFTIFWPIVRTQTPVGKTAGHSHQPIAMHRSQMIQPHGTSPCCCTDHASIAPLMPEAAFIDAHRCPKKKPEFTISSYAR